MGKREENRKIRRSKALNAARAIIIEDGVDGLSMRKLSDAASLAVNTLYAMFESRDGVLEAILVDGVTRSSAEFRDLPQDDPLTTFEQMVERSLARASENERFARTMYLAMTRLPGARRRAVSVAVPVVASTFRRAIDDGLFDPQTEPERLAHHFLDSFVSLATAWANDLIGDDEFRDQTRFVMRVVMRSAATDQVRSDRL